MVSLGYLVGQSRTAFESAGLAGPWIFFNHFANLLAYVVKRYVVIAHFKIVVVIKKNLVIFSFSCVCLFV